MCMCRLINTHMKILVKATCIHTCKQAQNPTEQELSGGLAHVGGLVRSPMSL